MAIALCAPQWGVGARKSWSGSGPAFPPDANNWPDHLPHHVLVCIDNDDFFPYLIEYRGGDQAVLAGSAAACFPCALPLASFEFIDVKFDIPNRAELFEFTPTESGWHDESGTVIDRLRPTPPKPEETAAARRNGTWR